MINFATGEIDHEKQARAHSHSPLTIGRLIKYEGSWWIIDKITPHENTLFTWTELTCSWSCMGTPPARQGALRILCDRRRKADWVWIPT